MATAERPTLLKVIVASPGDVLPERKAIESVITDLNRYITPQLGLELRAYRWETDTYPAFHLKGLQGHIDETLQIDNCDIMIGIFWNRFGTPVGDAQSGTEHELQRAYAGWVESKGKRPHIMVYFKNKEQEGKDDAEREQQRKVAAYKEKLSKQALCWPYKTKTEFEQLVRNHLWMYLMRHAGELGGKTYTVIRSADDLRSWNERIIDNAEKILFITGSRSRDPLYLKAIEKKLEQTPRLVHYRVLFGLPYHQALKDHLLQLLQLRSPDDRSQGFKTIHLGLFTNERRQAESFILGNEQQALVLLPSFLGVGEYNSGIIFTGKDEIDGLQRFVKQLYGMSEVIETKEKVELLGIR